MSARRRLGALERHVLHAPTPAAAAPAADEEGAGWPSMVPDRSAMDKKPKLAIVSTVW